jgi:hypothetical protein
MAGTWNELKREAGLSTRGFSTDKFPDEAVIVVLARLVARDKKWPTDLGLQRERKRDPSVPHIEVFRRVLAARDFIPRLVAYCDGRPEFHAVSAIALAQPISAPEEVLEGGRVNGYVYMMRSGRRYKIGKTSSPARRHREVRLDLPDPTSLVHTIETDDPGGIEAYWHARFASKRVRDTEFFELDARDVAAFKRRRYQ